MFQRSRPWINSQAKLPLFALNPLESNANTIWFFGISCGSVLNWYSTTVIPREPGNWQDRSGGSIHKLQMWILHFAPCNIILYEKGEFAMSEERWEVVAEIAGELQAEILRGMLEAQGIKVWISQEGAGRAYGLGVGRLGKVQILVPAGELEQANALLDAYYSGELENDDLDSDNLDEAQEV
jgi:hypothetical protein